MAGYQRCISLALVCLWLCHHSLAVDSTACLSLSSMADHNAFLRKHVREGIPSTSEVTAWLDYIKRNPLLGVTQSFLKPNELTRVLQVCSDEGGLRYTTNGILDQTNLCISKKRFNYFTVRYNQFNKNPYTIVDEKKHLILACGKVGNQCLPVHFESNSGDKQPPHQRLGCQSGTRPSG